MTTPHDGQHAAPRHVPAEPAPPAPAAALRGRRYSAGWVWLGILAGLAGLFAMLLLAQAAELALLASWLGLAIFVPLVVGIALLAVGGDPRRRGFGLGLMIGWGVLLLVGVGLYVAASAMLTPRAG